MTAQELINGALRLIGVIAAGETPSADESADALAAFNAMIQNWNEGIAKALAGSYASVIYTFNPLATYSDLSDTISLPGGWLRALRYNLAVDLAPEYGRPLDPAVVTMANQSRIALMTVVGPVAATAAGA